MSERLTKPLLTKREVRAIARKVIIEEGNKPDKERVERLTNFLLENLDDLEELVRLEARRQKK
jgi:hypothetical protein